MSNAIASPKQFDFIRSLVTERKVSNDIPDIDQFMAAITAQRLTKSGASALIDTLLKQPKDEIARTEQPAADKVPEHKANRYPGKCGFCNKTVAANEGRLDRENGKWVTYHLDGDCPEDLQAKLNALLDGRDDGYFAVPYIGGSSDTDLTFFGIRTRSNGDRFVVHVVGGHADTEDVSFTWIERALIALDAVDYLGALYAYGQRMGHCGLCGRHLTNEYSRAMGMGSDCAAKL